jgi:mitogen-activated protein kinase kinase 1
MNVGSLEKIFKAIQSKKISPPCIPESILSKITKQILFGLAYLHKEKHQIHRDIKPANILINADGIVKLTDFGISRTLEKSQAHTFVGSRIYMSPERITGKKYSYPSDIWSVGLVIYELATGTQPYGGGNDFLSQITKIVEDPEPKLDENIFSKELCDFIEKTIKKEEEKRANIDELLKHPFILNHEKDEESISQWLETLFEYKYSKINN